MAMQLRIVKRSRNSDVKRVDATTAPIAIALQILPPQVQEPPQALAPPVLTRTTRRRITRRRMATVSTVVKMVTRLTRVGSKTHTFESNT
jgi:hypothetical protein